MDDDFIKKRLERDMAELKRLCEDHFAKRREDDAKMEELKERIVKTKSVSNFSKNFETFWHKMTGGKFETYFIGERKEQAR